MEIIIVDDEPVSLTALKQMVEKQSAYCVRSFTQASAALAWCNQNDPDVLIVGYVMPELNGIEFVEHFRSLPGKAETPVLMVTANAELEVRARALRAGVNDFLTKPYDAAELQVRVNNMVLIRARQKNVPIPNAFVTTHVPAIVATDTLPQKDSNTLLDLKMTLTRLGEDETLLGQVARVFARTAPGLLESIGAALAGNDIERAQSEAHSLKGAVAVFEAPEVFNSVAAVETFAIAYNASAALAAFVAARTLVERLVTELAPVVHRPAAA
ncbi:MAG TPA: response regulator [Burkholderiales bacterium]